MSVTFTYQIEHPGEYEAGLVPYSDTVTVTVASGDPGGDDDGEESFQAHMLDALKKWYDGCDVWLDDKNPSFIARKSIGE